MSSTFSLGSTITDGCLLYDNFSPLTLFANNEQGVWYDPSDFSTMFTDNIGRTPVTTVGQSVGFLGDKSQGFALGAEQYVTGTGAWSRGFNSVDGTISATGPAITITQGAGDSSGLRWIQPITCVVGRVYRLQANDITRSGGTSCDVSITSNSDGIGVSSGNQISDTQDPGQVFITATATTMYVGIRLNGGVTGSTATFDNISVKELPGNHATQSNAASRPILGRVPVGGRRNLLTFTEQFDNAAWSKTGGAISATNGTAPDGTATADVLTEDSSTGLHFVAQLYTSVAGTYAMSCYVKANGRNFVFLYYPARNIGASFNLTTGAIAQPSGTAAPTSSSAQDVGNGWWRISMAFTGAVAGTSFRVYLADNMTGSGSYTGNGTAGVLLWGAQLEAGLTATAYQRVGTAFDVAQAGVPDTYYLSFDGTDDFLVTNTITPGIDKAQVFAGLRKLSTAAAGAVAELSASLDTNAGTFTILDRNSAAVSFQSKGTTASGLALSSVLTPPVSFVVTGTADISGDTAAIRINGVRSATATADQGTGNFGSYPLYIGRRGGTTLPFNGQLYSLIVRFGANLPLSTIIQTEIFTNQKTGAY